MVLKELLSPKEWLFTEDEFDPDKINFYETIFTIGNGYLGTRGSLEDGYPTSFAATYLNGIFDHNDSVITHLVNFPDWTSVDILVDGKSLNLQDCEILEYYRILDIKQGLLYRYTRYKDSDGNITSYESARYAHLVNKHLCELQIAVTPENYSGHIETKHDIDEDSFNLDHVPIFKAEDIDSNVEWMKWKKSKHLATVKKEKVSENYLYLEMKTLDRIHNVGYASILRRLNAKSKNCRQITMRGETIRCEKLVAIYTSKDVAVSNIKSISLENVQESGSLTFEKRFYEHKEAWRKKWQDSDIVIEGGPKANHAVRFSIYHLLIAAESKSPACIGAKTMSGEGYRGHVFWDMEIFTLPFYIYTQPETAKNILMYRYNTLVGAKENARNTGYRGARFPWESTDSGIEETPVWSTNKEKRIWPREEAVHITADVVKGLFDYFNVTGDDKFMLEVGAEIVFETARFWATRVEYNGEEYCYEIKKVTGPDEFHEHVDNSVFTNSMVRWHLRKAAELYNWLRKKYSKEFKQVISKLQLTKVEMLGWRRIAERISILYDPTTKLLEEFRGYYKLNDVKITNWDSNQIPIYPPEIDDANCYKSMLIKQADVVMLLYLLEDESDYETKKMNYKFYEPRTLHASSLSTSVYSVMAAKTGDLDKAVTYFNYSAYIDLFDLKKNTEAGIHCAAAGGVWQSMVHGFAGLSIRGGILNFDPILPKEWKTICFRIKWKGINLDISICQKKIEFFWHGGEEKTLKIRINNIPHTLYAEKQLSFLFC